jgi:peptidoglycan/LPS O-acetylase OafA/YrhL
MGAFMACHLLGFAAVQHRISLDRIARPVRWLAGMTFSLYLFHYPLLHLAASVWPGPLDSSLRVVALGALVLGAVALLAQVTERRKDGARRAVEAAAGLLQPSFSAVSSALPTRRVMRRIRLAKSKLRPRSTWKY